MYYDYFWSLLHICFIQSKLFNWFMICFVILFSFSSISFCLAQPQHLRLLCLNRMYISSDSDSLETNPVWSYISFICCCFFNFQFHNHEIHYSLYRFCFLFHMDTFFGGIRCRFIIYISCQMFRKHVPPFFIFTRMSFDFWNVWSQNNLFIVLVYFVLGIVTLFVISICSLILR